MHHNRYTQRTGRPVGRTQGQSGALKAMHKTERKAEKAGQVVVITGAAFVSAVEKKKQADKEHKEAKREFLQIVETIK